MDRIPVTCDNISSGLKVVDSEGNIGKVISCEDLHNCHVLFDGTGVKVKVHGKSIECGGSSLYCFHSGCEENDEEIDPLYLYDESNVPVKVVELPEEGIDSYVILDYPNQF
jgi:hypothetical protein